jgi:hypothetical protein
VIYGVNSFFYQSDWSVDFQTGMPPCPREHVLQTRMPAITPLHHQLSSNPQDKLVLVLRLVLLLVSTCTTGVMKTIHYGGRGDKEDHLVAL